MAETFLLSQLATGEMNVEMAHVMDQSKTRAACQLENAREMVCRHH